VRQQQRPASHAGRGEGGLGAGMPSANDDNIKFFMELHGNCLQQLRMRMLLQSADRVMPGACFT
jgi:hypothetical protein